MLTLGSSSDRNVYRHNTYASRSQENEDRFDRFADRKSRNFEQENRFDRESRKSRNFEQENRFDRESRNFKQDRWSFREANKDNSGGARNDSRAAADSAGKLERDGTLERDEKLDEACELNTVYRDSYSEDESKNPDEYGGHHDGHDGHHDGHDGHHDGHDGHHDGHDGHPDEYDGDHDGYDGHHDGYDGHHDGHDGHPDEYDGDHDGYDGHRDEHEHPTYDNSGGRRADEAGADAIPAHPVSDSHQRIIVNYRDINRTWWRTGYIGERLGSGSNGQVYQVLSQETDTPVGAVKLPKAGGGLRYEKTQAEFRHEIKINRILSGVPGVGHFIGVTEFGHPVHELLGSNLQRLLTDTREVGDLKTSFMLGMAVLDDLAGTLAQTFGDYGITHGDIKPDNIMVPSDIDMPGADENRPFFRLIDWGWAFERNTRSAAGAEMFQPQWRLLLQDEHPTYRMQWLSKYADDLESALFTALDIMLGDSELTDKVQIVRKDRRLKPWTWCSAAPAGTVHEQFEYVCRRIVKRLYQFDWNYILPGPQENCRDPEQLKIHAQALYGKVKSWIGFATKKLSWVQKLSRDGQGTDYTLKPLWKPSEKAAMWQKMLRDSKWVGKQRHIERALGNIRFNKKGRAV